MKDFIALKKNLKKDFSSLKKIREAGGVLKLLNLQSYVKEL